MSSPAELAMRPLVFAHRGGRALGPENTLVALDNGFAAGADGAEFDVQLSGDGHAVVIHDTTLDRTTNARGPVARRTLAELAAVDATVPAQRPRDRRTARPHGSRSAARPPGSQSARGLRRRPPPLS